MENPTASPETSGSRQLVYDLFHHLSQPLTTLICSLELALLQTPTLEQYAEIASRALGQAQKVSWLATAIRELFDAGQAGEHSAELDLRPAIEDAVADLLPVAESAQVQVRFLAGPVCLVCFDPQRLRLGLFHLLAFAVSAAAAGAVMTIELQEHEAEAVLGLTISETCHDTSDPGSEQELARRLGLGIARAVFEAAGGSLKTHHETVGEIVEIALRGIKRPVQSTASAPGHCFS